MRFVCAETYIRAKSHVSKMARRCFCDEIPDVVLEETGGAPSPRTPALKIGGGESKGGVVLACIIAAAIAIIATVLVVKRERFFTEYAREEPVRSYTPYTGTIPYGPWGTNPWVEAHDLAPPSAVFGGLPPAYRDPTNVL
ncbi:MAG: hypothetical protein KGL39_23980 [Patescibacteria group bacterium]|nr:hypothetical protein [Patescibacteria group bacterium]